MVSEGLQVKLIAKAGRRVQYADGTESKLAYHGWTDGAGVIPLDDGGYVYVANSEDDNRKGGVYGLYFDKNAEVVEYKALLTGTTWNCGGGISPWNTWISCEEHSSGQCWQVDPNPSSIHHEKPEKTKLGGNGGKFESVAVDNTNPRKPVFFTTEDDTYGALRRFEAPHGDGWNALHEDGRTTFLVILGDGTFKWTSNQQEGRASAGRYFQNSEGIQVHERKLFFMAKVSRQLYILDLDNNTYEVETTGKKFYGEGSFGDQPDQGLIGSTHKWIYFTEDGGRNPGVYARYGSDGSYYTVFQGIDGRYANDETVGIALSPDNKRLYAGIQTVGMVFEFTREDGMPFE